ncbi:MAG: hypothetical protein C5B53_13340 [Candidatus Melainabacteria bacterium]|nr:MAG: hypothetical protein C5B53_13340 [Candidatus Melainabacteria bacterium]
MNRNSQEKNYSKAASRSALVLAAFLLVYSVDMHAACSFSLFNRTHRDCQSRLPVFSQSDLHSDVASPEAVELARHLELIPLFQRLEELRDKVQPPGRQSSNTELREEFRDIKEEITEKIVQTRLEVDFVQAELAVELAAHNELLNTYSRARDDAVNRTNIWAFRTNGALWAVAEGLDIPTYKKPRYSIPSGSIGIIAGIVPSVFSAFAVRESSGFGYEREPYPNMLTQLFDYPRLTRTDIPASVLTYLHAKPAYAEHGESRADWLVNRWVDDKNLSVFNDRKSRSQKDAITGMVQSHLTIQLVSDRLTMLQQLSAMINQINRPLLELMMVVRGTKHLPPAN